MKDVQNRCKWLHEQLEQVPLTKYPFNVEQLPRNGIYFFYEKGETWGHGGDKPRIVRIGTHKANNFRSRIKEHFLLDERKMNFDSVGQAPKDRSIFRKNIGRALLNKHGSRYLKIWEIDFTSRNNREKYSHLRNIEYEKSIETQVTLALRNNFSFRFILVEEETERMGTKGLESRLIGTVAQCSLCQPSNSWLGKHSPKMEIRRSGLWLVQHLSSSPITIEEKNLISIAITRTKRYATQVARTIRVKNQ